MRLIEAENLPCVIAGGYALDARRGRRTRRHKDWDAMALAEDRDRIAGAFERTGFTVEERRPGRLVVSDGLGNDGDVFLWRDVGGGLVEHVGWHVLGAVVRVPRDVLLQRQRGRMERLTFWIPCDDYLRCVSPFVRNVVDLAFLRALPSPPSLRLRTRPADALPGYTLYEWRRV